MVAFCSSLEICQAGEGLCTLMGVGGGGVGAARWGVHRVVAALNLSTHGEQEGQRTPRLS